MNIIPPLIPKDVKYSLLRTDLNTNIVIDGNPTLWKSNVKVATLFSIQLLNSQIIDGIEVNYGDRVLVKNNTLEINGIYIVNKVWKRSSDMKIGIDASGCTIYITEGSQNANTFYVCANETSAIVGTDYLDFQPMRYTYNGPLGSIQYNYSTIVSDSFYGSEAFVFTELSTPLPFSSIKGIHRDIVNIGPNVNIIENNKESIIKLKGNNTAGTISSFETSVDSGGTSFSSLDINSGGHITVKDRISSDGKLNISTFGETSGDIYLLTTDLATSVYKNITIYPGYNTGSPDTDHVPGNVYFESGYCNFSPTTINPELHKNISLTADLINLSILSASDIIMTNGGFIISKNTTIFSDTNFAIDVLTLLQTGLIVNERQGIISSTVTTTVAPAYWAEYRIYNDKLDADSIVIVNMVSYAGTAVPIINVMDKTLTYFSVYIYNGSSSVTLSLNGLSFSFILM